MSELVNPFALVVKLGGIVAKPIIKLSQGIGQGIGEIFNLQDDDNHHGDEHDGDEHDEVAAPEEDCRMSLEGTLWCRKGKTKSWKRRLVVLKLEQEGIFECYKVLNYGRSRMLKDVYSQLHRQASVGSIIRDSGSQTLQLLLGRDTPWIARDIPNDPSTFVIEIPTDNLQVLNSLIFEGSQQAFLGSIQTESFDEGPDGDITTGDDQATQSAQMDASLLDISDRPNMTLSSRTKLERDFKSAQKKQVPLRLYFNCPRSGNEKALWLRGFAKVDRLGEPWDKRNFFGKIAQIGMATSRIRRDVFADFTRDARQLEIGVLSPSYKPLKNPTMPNIEEHIERREFMVYPTYCYPHVWMTQSELLEECNLPSTTMHDLRIDSMMGKEIGTLRVEVLQCFGLPKLDRNSESDAVCYLVCGSYAFATDVIPNNAHPIWPRKSRRGCLFPVFHGYARLFVGVFDDDVGPRDDVAGRVVIDLSRLRPTSRNYVRYGIDGPGCRGFVPPTWEEMLRAVVTDQKHSIRPISMTLTDDAGAHRNPLLADGDDPVYDVNRVETHVPWGKQLFRFIGFLEEDRVLARIPQHERHLEFPFSNGTVYPPLSVRESMAKKPHKSRENDEFRPIRSLCRDRLSRVHKDRGEYDSLEFDGDTAETDDDDILLDTEISRSVDENLDNSTELDPAAPLPSTILIPDQDIDFVHDSGGKKFTDDLEDMRENMHRLTWHVFNYKTHIVKHPESVFFGQGKKAARGKDTKREIEKLLNLGSYSSSNMIVSRAAPYVAPLLGAALSFLGVFRTAFNVFTWRDPFMSFWVSVFGLLVTIILFYFPWRLFLLVTGCIVVGPQPLVKAHPLPNTKHADVSMDQIDPREVHHVVIPYSQLASATNRFYDWPPEPEFSHVKYNPPVTKANNISGPSTETFKSKTSAGNIPQFVTASTMARRSTLQAFKPTLQRSRSSDFEIRSERQLIRPRSRTADMWDIDESKLKSE
ncbi:Protein kinase C conserved region 2 [Fragilaria crotonensis]|nr:Protein kinase C conserved region 2 [Fragilaria crotonensis]